MNQPIKVGAIFEGITISPKWFIWESRKYTIKTITYTWSDHTGQDTIRHFAVTDGTNTYELTYNPLQSIWRLTKISSE